MLKVMGLHSDEVPDRKKRPADSNSPAVAHSEGRKRFWHHDEVTEFLAKRAR